jgi:RNA polymerase sigma factor (TIGR02999 family)
MGNRKGALGLAAVPMSEDARSLVTDIVAQLGTTGREEASASRLMPLVYDELRRLARGFMDRERRDHTLQPTALVHEAYVRLVDQLRVNWRGRTHFRAVGARVMRRILVDHARRHGSAKRGRDWQRVTLGDSLLRSSDAELDLAEVLSLNDALGRLRETDRRQARIVELRYFGGLTSGEVAEVLGVSLRTVEGEWMHGRAWLKRELTVQEAP